MIKVLHWCAWRMSDAGRFLADAGERLWELGGALECYAERKRWQRWAKKYGYKVIDVKLAAFDPSELSMPAPRAWPGQED